MKTIFTLILLFLVTFAVFSQSKPAGKSTYTTSSSKTTATPRPVSTVKPSNPQNPSGWTFGRKASTPKPVDTSTNSNPAPSPKSSGWLFGGKKSQTPTTLPSVDKAALQKAKESGKLFTSREDAIKNFKQKEAVKYTNKFDKEPVNRPSHIPQYYNNQTIVYRDNSYQYYDNSLNRWLMYDAIQDAVMVNILMQQEGYMHHQPEVVYVNQNKGASVVIWILAVALMLLIIGGLAFKFTH